MFHVSVQCYLWDLVDEGIDDVLDRLKGEAGATGISVGLAMPKIDELRCHPGVSPRSFRCAGGAQFQADLSLYAGTRVRPVVAGWLRKSNPLPALAEACTKRGMELRAWIVACDSLTVVERNPNAACKDLFGDPSPNRLCPVNPDVREYLRALVAQASETFAISALELDAIGFAAPHRVHHAAQIGMDVGEVGRWLLRLCFCESCRQAADRHGIDSSAAARAAELRLERIFRKGEAPEQSVQDVLGDDPLLAEYTHWRCSQVTALLRSIRESCRCRLVLHRRGTTETSGTDYRQLAGFADGLLAPASPTDGVPVSDAIEAAQEDVTGTNARVEVAVDAGFPSCGEAASLVRALSQAAHGNACGAVVSNYGMIPLARLDWIKQAARYAQRETS